MIHIFQDGSIVNKFTRGSLTKTKKRIKFTARLKADDGGNSSAQETFSGFVVAVQKMLPSSVRVAKLDEPLGLREGDNIINQKNDIIHQWEFTLDGYICPKV